MRIEAFQFSNFWVAVGVWLILYLCDYYLSIISEKLRRKNAQKNIEMDGSFELNPYYQKDIDALRLFSKRFMVSLLYGVLLLGLARWIADTWNFPELFTVAAGYLLSTELLVLASHVENISLLNFMGRPGVVEGRIKFARWAQVIPVARKFGYWALAFSFFFFVSGSWFFFGGALRCLRGYIGYNALGRKLWRESPVLAKTSTSQEEP